MFFALGCAGLVFNSLQSLCSGVIGANLTYRVRRMALAAALRQEIGFYDNERNSSGTLCARLQNDASIIKILVGDSLLLSKPHPPFDPRCMLIVAILFSVIIDVGVFGLGVPRLEPHRSCI